MRHTIQRLAQAPRTRSTQLEAATLDAPDVNVSHNRLATERTGDVAAGLANLRLHRLHEAQRISSLRLVYSFLRLDESEVGVVSDDGRSPAASVVVRFAAVNRVT